MNGESSTVNNAQSNQGSWAQNLPELLRVINDEPEQDVKLDLINTLATCIELLGYGCLTNAMMTDVLRILEKLLTEHFKRDTVRRQKRADEGYNEVIEEQLLDEEHVDVYALFRVDDMIHALMSAYREEFLPHFDILLPHLVELFRPGRLVSDLHRAICIFDDVIEFGGPACVKYQDIFLGPMLTGLQSDVAPVRQAAAYGCGVLAQFGGTHFAAACARAVPLLVAIISEPEARAVENVHATENAISAVTKIIKYNHSKFNRNQMIRRWLTWLPVTMDVEEASHVYSFLCELVVSKHAAVVSTNGRPRVIAIIAEAFLKEVLRPTNPVYAQMVGVVRQIQNNAELYNSCLTQLSNEHKQALSTALST